MTFSKKAASSSSKHYREKIIVFGLAFFKPHAMRYLWAIFMGDISAKGCFPSSREGR
jgi:hypothetical protein